MKASSEIQVCPESFPAPSTAVNKGSLCNEISASGKNYGFVCRLYQIKLFGFFIFPDFD